MAQIYYLPDEQAVDTEAGHSILSIALRAGIPHTHACGGKARCSTCRVAILNGLSNVEPRTDDERVLADLLHLAPDIRLACQTKIKGDVRLRRLVLDHEDEILTDQERPDTVPVPVGMEKHVAIMFADIRNFTPFSERLLPYDIIHVLNRYFHLIGESISGNGGFISNYMGDGIMALFGAEGEPEPELQAVKAALAMLETVEQLKSYLDTTYHSTFDIGIGIHCGEVVVGSVGSLRRKMTTAIGAAVNVANRVEAANKQAGTNLLISEPVYRMVADQVEVGHTTRVTLKGKTGAQTLYEIVGLQR